MLPPHAQRAGLRHREAPDVSLTLGLDLAWCRAQAILAGFVALVVSHWLWALLWAWPEHEPPAWLVPIRWASMGLVSLWAVMWVWRAACRRPAPLARLSWTSIAGWQGWAVADGWPFPCTVRLSIDLGDWVLLRVDRVQAEKHSSTIPSIDLHAQPRRAWLALSRSNHLGTWHDFRLALAHRSPK
jgi:hypothetical protein